MVPLEALRIRDAGQRVILADRDVRDGRLVDARVDAVAGWNGDCKGVVGVYVCTGRRS